MSTLALNSSLVPPASSNESKGLVKYRSHISFITENSVCFIRVFQYLSLLENFLVLGVFSSHTRVNVREKGRKIK